MALTYIYTRLEVSLDNLAISALFRESDNEQGLEALSESLSVIMTDKTLSELYTTAAIRDLLEIHAFSTKDVEVNQVIEDFKLLAALVRARIERYVQYPYGVLRAIHLEYPNTLILECHAVKQQRPQPKVALRRLRIIKDLA